MISTRSSDLSRLLERHEPHDEREAGCLQQMRELLASPGDPFDRNRFTPGHFTASAFVLAPGRRCVLMIHHAKLSRWLQPGGHMEGSDADPAAAAQREVEEETGLTGLVATGDRPAPLDLDIHPIPGRPGEPGHRHFDVRFLFRAPHERVHRGDGVNEARWVPLAELGTLNPEPAMTRIVAKLRAKKY